MRYFASLGLLLMVTQFYSVSAISQSTVTEEADIIEIGQDLYLETIPAKYGTYQSDDPGPLTEPEWIVIPAVYETVSEIKIIQEAYVDVRIVPPVYRSDGFMVEPAKAILEEVPAVTRQVTRRVVKTPSRVVKRVVPNMYHPGIIRKKVAGKVYILRDEAGLELQRYDDPVAIADYINSK